MARIHRTRAEVVRSDPHYGYRQVLLTGAASPDFEKAGAEIRVDSGPIESK